jgi:hypothetical protein
MPKMVPAPTWEQHSQFRNVPLDAPPQLPQHRNPDGAVVESFATVGSLGLYIDTPAGERVDAETLCRRFVDHLQSLLVRVAEQLG